MELNRNKLIFFIIAGVIVFLLILLLIFGGKGNKNTNIKSKTGPNDLTIWTVFPDFENPQELVTEFKKVFPKYASTNIKIENFSDYETYTYALQSAFSSFNGPDVFVLNNNETSVFADMTLGINPERLKVSDFRKYYKNIFTDNLILQSEDAGEFLLGVPVGYETLGVFYNKRYVKASDLKSISALNAVISKLKTRNPSSTPLGIGNGTTVKFAPDIATQFMLLEEGESSISKLSNTQIKTGLLAYLNYGYKDSDNNFNSKYQTLKDRDENSSYLFANNDSFMVFGYPRFVNDIEKNGGIPVNFLFAEPFPHYTPGKGKALVNYNYFVLNKNSKNIGFGEDFLAFLFTEQTQKKFLELYPFYLPGLLSLESELDNIKIHKKYNVTLSDFYDDNYQLTSFDKGIKNIYDNQMEVILDLGDNYSDSFDNFKTKLVCMTNKALNFTNIGKSCE